MDLRIKLLFLTLSPACVYAAPVRVGTTKCVATGTGTSANCSYTAGTGNLLVVACAAQGINLTELRVTDGPNTWVKDQFIADFQEANSNGEGISVYHATKSVGGALTINCDANAPGGGLLHVDKGFTIYVSEYSGFGSTITGDGSNPVTQYSITASTSPLTPILQTANASALLISAFNTTSNSGSCITSPGSGWTMVQSNSDGSASPCSGLMEQIVSSTGNYTASATVASSPWVISIQPYVPTASAPSVISTGEVAVASSTGYWSTSVNASNGATGTLATYNGKQYAGYADSTLHLKIGVITLATGSVSTCDPGLPAFPSGSDNHGAVSIGIDKNGYIHVSFGTHTSALNYYKSTSPEDCSAFSGPLSMLGGTPETNVTFGMFFKNPANSELYFTYHFGAYNSGNQYFYHYNSATPAWESPSGTNASGQLTNYTSADPFLNGLPKWDQNGVLWWTWILYGVEAGGTDFHNKGYAVGWSGSSYEKLDGSAQASPVTLANLASSITFGSGDQPGLGVLNGFSVDSSGSLFVPYKNTDGSGIYQVYVAESSTGSFVSHQLTSNSISFNPPNPILFAGTIQSTAIFSRGACTYVVWNDIYDQRSGTRADKSCDNFSTVEHLYLGSSFNPNWMLFPDSDKQSMSNAPVSFLFENANDPQLMFTYINNFSSQQGRISVLSLNLGGSAIGSGTSAVGGTFK